MTVRAPFVNVSGDPREMPSGDSLPVSSFGAIGGAVIAPTALAANTNDWNPTSAAVSTFWKVSASATVNLTGITAPTTAGTLLEMENVGSYPIALTHQDTSSASGNRFNTPTAATVYLAPSATIRLFYDGTYWQILANSSMSPAEVLAYFGDGSDGAATITTASQTVGSWLTSGAMTRDAYLTNLTINSTGAIKTAGFRLYINGVLDISAAGAGAITNNGAAGNNASSNTGGTSGASQAPGSLPLSGNPVGSTNGATGAGGTAGGVSSPTLTLGGSNGASGAGGAGTSAGGAAHAANAVTQWVPRWLSPVIQYLFTGSATISTLWSSVPGIGGSSGGGNGTNAGGGGGGPGAGAGTVFLFARYIYRGTNSTPAIIQAKGGNGGNGGNGAGVSNTGGGGGASGAGGGCVMIACEALLGSAITGAIDVTGGSGGAFGTATTGGVNGSAGSAGFGGLVIIFTIGIGASTVTSKTASQGGTQQVNL